MTDPRIFDTAVKMAITDLDYRPFGENAKTIREYLGNPDGLPSYILEPYVIAAEKLVAGLDAVIAYRQTSRTVAMAKLRSDQTEHRP